MSKKSADTLAETIAGLQKARGTLPIPTPNQVPDEAMRSADVIELMPGLAAKGTFSIKIRVDLLDDSPSQYRLVYPNDEIELLGATLLQGQIEPIKVRRKADGRYELITGHRRTRAAKAVEMETLDAIVVEVDDKRAAVELILANESQESVGDFERATGYKFLIDYGMKQMDIAEALGVSRALVSQRLRFFDLPTPILEALSIYPRAFSHNTVPLLCDAVKGSPEMIPEIVEGIKKLGSGEWTHPTLMNIVRSSLTRGTSAKETSGVLAIADRDSRPVLTMQGKAKGRVEIQLAKGIDQDLFIKNLTELLREAALKDGALCVVTPVAPVN